MLFGCLPLDCKCEHVILRRLVTEYNLLHGGVYTRWRRPDVEERNQMAPDLLLEGPGATSVAIERKCVVWPAKGYMPDHRNSHDLLWHVQNGVCSEDDSFIGGLYQLRFEESSIRGLSNREIQSIGFKIAKVVLENAVIAKSARGLGGDEPFIWWFGPFPSQERDETTPDSGFGMLAIGEGGRGLPSRARVLEGYAGEFYRLMTDIDEKFSRYDNCRRLIAVQFFGDPLMPIDEADIVQMIVTGELPNTVDEVWLAYHDWANADEYEVAWKCIRG